MILVYALQVECLCKEHSERLLRARIKQFRGPQEWPNHFEWTQIYVHSSHKMTIFCDCSQNYISSMTIVYSYI
jgi:hypothetical protein